MHIYQRNLIHDLDYILKSSRLHDLIEVSIEQNIWFTHQTILRAIDSIRSEMLNESKVLSWIDGYNIPADHPPCTAGIVMAGNIPLVGFFDLLCALITGNAALVKPSSKDRVLITNIVEQLAEKGYSTKIVDTISPIDVDVLIATGGADAASFFATQFSDKPTLIRSDRHSVAVLTGNESTDELNLLLDDMFLYWGLGCRNVTKIFVPVGYNYDNLPNFNTYFKPLIDNYRQSKALYTMLARSYIDKKGYLLVPDIVNPKIGVVGYSVYSKMSEIELNETRIQCVVTNCEIDFPRKVSFGMSQRPSLSDYPDSKDVIKFLLNPFN